MNSPTCNYGYSFGCESLMADRMGLGSTTLPTLLSTPTSLDHMILYQALSRFSVLQVTESWARPGNEATKPMRQWFFAEVETRLTHPHLLWDGIEAIDVDPSPEQALVEDDAEGDPEGRNEEIDCLTEQQNKVNHLCVCVCVCVLCEYVVCACVCMCEYVVCVCVCVCVHVYVSHF